uniref:Small monomeric GTPase n=1 Tax=Dicentrarchus labrax TaxID=13489 RepID=A0A8P4K0N3_DICLA
MLQWGKLPFPICSTVMVLSSRRTTACSCCVSSIGGSEVTGTSIINTAGFWKATRTDNRSGAANEMCEHPRDQQQCGVWCELESITQCGRSLPRHLMLLVSHLYSELYIIDSAGKQTLVEACEKMWGELSLLCLVFDLTSEQSFANCSHWMERVHAHCHGLHIPGVLVGNKSDLSARREVQVSVAQEWAQTQGLEYYETSAVSAFQYERYIVFLFGFVGKVHQMGCTVFMYEQRATSPITVCSCLSLAEGDGELRCTAPWFSPSLPLSLPRTSRDHPEPESSLDPLPSQTHTHLDILLDNRHSFFI